MRLVKIGIAGLLLFTFVKVGWANFVDTNALLPGVMQGSIAWGDFDNDGDLDLAIAGNKNPGFISKIYRNDGGNFVDINAPLVGVGGCSLAWGDYDNDGDLDLAIAGHTDSGPISKIYRNDNGAFVDINAGLPGVEFCALAWGDYDNDGYPDLALCGIEYVDPNSANLITRIYHNERGKFDPEKFVDINIGLGGVGVGYSSLAWGDYDNDGDLDLTVAGYTVISTGTAANVTRIFRNGQGSFLDINAGLVGVSRCSLAWGDYDNDGDLDLAISGRTDSGSLVTKIYNNDRGSFWDINAPLVGTQLGSLAWGDYNNDGNLDLAVVGWTDTGQRIAKIYQNDSSGNFMDFSAGLTGVSYSSLAWGDYDGDGVLDLILSGWTGSQTITKLYHNTYMAYDVLTFSPSSGFSSSYSSATATLELHWDTGSDNYTSSNGLYYTVRMSPQSPIDDSNARIVSWRPSSPFMGNYPHGFVANGQPGLKLKGLDENATYYWQVRTIGTGFKSSNWSPEQIIRTVPQPSYRPPTPTLIYPENGAVTNSSGIEFRWNPVADIGSGLGHYLLQIFDTGDLSHLIYETTASTTVYSVDWPLTADVTYYWRVNAQDNAGRISDWSEVWKLVVDRTIPIGEITAPRARPEDGNIAYVNSLQPLFAANASDQFSGVKSVLFDFGVGTFEDSTPPYQAEWEEKQLSDASTNYFKISVYDWAGNYSESSILVACDVSAPTVKIVSPSDNKKIKGSITISGTTNDSVSGIRQIELYYSVDNLNDIYIDSVTANGEIWNYNWNTSQAIIKTGDITITAKAIDKAGNSGADKVRVKLLPSNYLAFGPIAENDLSNLIVYPNPYKPNSGLGQQGIIFSRLTSRAKIEIFTLTGQKVREIDKDDGNGDYRWDGRNGEGESLASGVYLYRVTSGGEEKIGKIAVVK